MKLSIRNNAKRKLAAAAALFTLVMSQSGFITGLCTLWSPAGVPLVVTGVVTFVVGGSLASVPDYGTNIAGWTLFSIGVVLDEKDPGHVAALNEVSNTTAQQQLMGVTSDEITAYNDKLAGTQIQAAYDKLKAESLAEVNKWASVNQAEVSKYKEIQVSVPRTLTQDSLEQVASHLELSQSDAKILLFKTFGTVVK